MAMPMPYEGEEPYVFVSYSHKDAADAIALITRLTDRGYLVWYDRGNTAGVKWRINITRHVKACAVFLPMISRNFNESENCLDELATAIDGNKRLVPVFLEDIEPPEEGEMRIRRMQILHRWKYMEEEFYIELYQSAELQQCLPAIKNETDFVGETENMMKNDREGNPWNVQESLLTASGWAADLEWQKEQVLLMQNHASLLTFMENKAEVAMPRSSPAAENARTGAAPVVTLPKEESGKTAEDFRKIPEVQSSKKSIFESFKNFWKKSS